MIDTTGLKKAHWDRVMNQAVVQVLAGVKDITFADIAKAMTQASQAPASRCTPFMSEEGVICVLRRPSYEIRTREGSSQIIQTISDYANNSFNFQWVPLIEVDRLMSLEYES